LIPDPVILVHLNFKPFNKTLMNKNNRTILDIPGMRELTNGLILISFLFLTGLACSKSSSSTSGTGHPPACTTDLCRLTSYKWEIASQTVSTDIGVFTHSISQVATENWATFVFRPDSSYTTYGGQTETYTYTPSTKKMVLVDNLLPIHFDVTFPTPTSMSLDGGKIQMNPRTDSSVEANFAINSIAGDLHDNFGVDTSKIHYIQAVFIYNGF
jgi:hypothetical protein